MIPPYRIILRNSDKTMGIYHVMENELTQYKDDKMEWGKFTSRAIWIISLSLRITMRRNEIGE